MPQEIPVDALKAAVAKLNSILEEGKIKTVGKKKADIVTAFAEKVSEITEAGKAKDLPGECIEFFNTYIVSDDDAPAADTKKDAPAAGKKGAAKKGAAPAAGSKKGGDRRDSERRGADKKSSTKEMTREESIVHAMRIGGTKEEIVAKSDSLYVEKGGSANTVQSAKLFDRAVKYFSAYGALVLSGNKYSLK